MREENNQERYREKIIKIIKKQSEGNHQESVSLALLPQIKKS